jgi:hypothetical protein
MPQEIKQEGLQKASSHLSVTQQDAMGMHTRGINRILGSENQRSCHNGRVQNGDPRTHNGQCMYPMDRCKCPTQQHRKTCSREI